LSFISILYRTHLFQRLITTIINKLRKKKKSNDSQ
jgi:hypothetical protein